MHVWLEFFDDSVDGLMVFEVLLDDVAEQLGLLVLLKGLVSDCELYGLCVVGEENGIDCFCGIGDEVVVVEVGDEVGEF